MRKAPWLLILIALLAPCGHPQTACTVRYTIIQRDQLGNIQQGVGAAKVVKWLTGDLEKKFPDVCYAAPDPSVGTVLFITVTPATYHGTQIVSTRGSQSGTVTDDDGDTANYSGTTTSSTAVPYSFEYGRYLLTVESMGPNNSVTVRHRFQQDGIYRTLYGIPLGGRGHHPEKALVEDAVKWIHQGGLNNPLESAQ
ncbi:MAG: hypothetical protein WB622_14470 [Acidobacteriaceae bacterium]